MSELLQRRKTCPIHVGNIIIGGTAPISVQSMTNTKTHLVADTVAQIERLSAAGCDIVRLAIPDMPAALAIKEIKSKIKIPLIADIHFDYRLAIAAMESGIDALRINPGNIGEVSYVAMIVKEAKKDVYLYVLV